MDKWFLLEKDVCDEQFFVNFLKVRIIWKKRILIQKLFLYKYVIGKFVGYFLISD